MASKKMHDYLDGAWSIAEWNTRPHIASTPEKMAKATAHAAFVKSVLIMSHKVTDRELARLYPEFIQQRVPPGYWDRIKPNPPGSPDR